MTQATPSTRSRQTHVSGTPQRAAKPKTAPKHADATDGAEPTLAETPTSASAVKGPTGKLGVVVALIARPEGATVAQISAATDWQAHSVRGAIAGALKKKHNLTIISEAADGGRVYRLGGTAA